ncbi:AB-hydrolase YheT, partial [Martensiomyces pterosporus]
CPSIADPQKAYLVPTPYLCSGILQTAYKAVTDFSVDKCTDIKYDRETHIMSDRGTVSLDWYPSQCRDKHDRTPIAIIMTGVGGSSREYCIRAIAKALADGPLCYRAVVMNHRGSGRTPLTSPLFCSIHDTGDIREMALHMRMRYPNAPLVAVGLSLGANVLAKYLGEEGSSCPLAAAVTVGCPFDMTATGRLVDGDSLLSSYLVRPKLVNTLRRYLLSNEQGIQSGDTKYDMDGIRRARFMHEIGDLVPVMTLGMKNCWEYYDYASSSHVVDRICTPYLAINSLDDPVSAAEGVPVDKFRKNPNIALALVKYGGHLGFFTGMQPKIWYLKPVVEFFAAMV